MIDPLGVIVVKIFQVDIMSFSPCRVEDLMFRICSQGLGERQTDGFYSDCMKITEEEKILCLTYQNKALKSL